MQCAGFGYAEKTCKQGMIVEVISEMLQRVEMFMNNIRITAPKAKECGIAAAMRPGYYISPVRFRNWRKQVLVEAVHGPLWLRFGLRAR